MSSVANNLWKRKGRTSLTILAVAISCALLVSMLSITEGIRQNAVEAISMSQEDVSLSGAITPGHGVAERLEADPLVDVVSPNLYGSLVVVVERTGESVPVMASGVVPEKEIAFRTKADRGSMSHEFPTQGDPFYQNGTYEGGLSSPLFTGEAVISNHLALDLSLSVGDKLLVTRGDETGTLSVVGVLTIPLTDDAPFRIYFVRLHISELQYLGSPVGTPESMMDAYDSISINLADDVRTSLAKTEAFADALRDEYKYYSVETKRDQTLAMEKSVDVSEGYFIGLGGVTVSVGLLFVITIVIMNIAERTKEIGILRAIGVSRRSIFLMFFLESLLMVFLGSLLGVVFGIAGSQMLGAYIADSFGIDFSITIVTPQLVLFSVLSTNLLGSLASLYPGYRASKMKIAEAMKYVG